MLLVKFAFSLGDAIRLTSSIRKSADYRHTLSWLTTSHNSLWGMSAPYRCIPNKNCNSPLAFRGGDSDSD